MDHPVGAVRTQTQLFGILLFAYAVLAALLAHAPLQDLPNHLARAHVIADLLFDHGAVYANAYSLNFSFSPYLAGDLALATFDHFLGMETAARLWIGIAILSIPLSAAFVARCHGLSQTAAVTAGLLALYVATDWFFVMGFMNYQLGMPCTLFAYGWFVRAKRSAAAGDYALFLIWVLAGYLMHLSALIFTIALIGISTAVGFLGKQFSFGRAVRLLALPMAFLALHFVLARIAAGHDALAQSYQSHWGSVHDKARGLTSAFRRFDRVPEGALFLLLLIAACYRIRWAALKSTRNVEFALIAIAFAGLYVVMPVESGGVYSVDVRAMPYALLFVLYVGISCADMTDVAPRRQMWMAGIFASANLVLLATVLLPANAALGRYETIAAGIPAGAHVLPIDTRTAQGRYQFYPHAGSYAVVESAALIPSLFAADQNPPMSYFHYRRRPYSPFVFWYTESDATLDWAKVREDYRYLLITLPWDAARIPSGLKVVRQNDVAALLDLEPVR